MDAIDFYLSEAYMWKLIKHQVYGKRAHRPFPCYAGVPLSAPIKNRSTYAVADALGVGASSEKGYFCEESWLESR